MLVGVKHTQRKNAFLDVITGFWHCGVAVGVNKQNAIPLQELSSIQELKHDMFSLCCAAGVQTGEW